MAFSQFDLDQMQARLSRNKLREPPGEFTPCEKEVGKGGLHEQIIAECNRRQWMFFHGSTAHKTFRSVGEPDFTIMADKGRVFFIEAKSRLGKLSTEQLALKMVAEQLGHAIHTIRSIEEFRSLTTLPHQPSAKDK